MKSFTLCICGASLLLLSLSGCKSSKTASATTTDYTSRAATVGSDADVSVKTLAASYGEWNDLYVPVTLQVTSPVKASIGARARMVRNKCIDLSLRFFGMEIARVWISSDSIVAASRKKKVYLAESLTALTSDISINVGNLQDMLLGRPFILGGTTLSADNAGAMYLESSDNSLRLLPREQPELAEYGYVLDLPTVVGAFAAVSADDRVTFSATYTGVQSIANAGNLAEATELSVVTSSGASLSNYTAGLTWQWKNAKWNEGTSVEPPSTEGLTRITSAQLLKIAKGLM
jgi:hypothetical protein